MKTNSILLIILTATLLVSCEQKEMTSPVAIFDLQTPPRHMFKVNLDASASFSTLPSDFLEYRWDLDGDHLAWETGWLSSPVLTLQFPYVYLGYIGLQVRNSSGNITELYQGFYPDEHYYIDNAFSDLEIDFRKITYHFSNPDNHRSWTWAYNNIQLTDSDECYNFFSGADRAEYGSLMSWDVAGTLDDHYYLPARADWQEMIDYCSGAGLAGFNLQIEAEHGLHLSRPGIVINGLLQEHGTSGYYWTSDEVDANSAWALKISADSDLAGFIILDKSSKASVRLMHEYFQYFK